MSNPRENTIHRWDINTPLTDEQYHEQFVHRFWKRVDKTPGQGPKGDCWTWTGSRMAPNSYGQLGYNRWPNGKSNPMRAHVASYFIHTGELPIGDDVQICHSCDNPPCVNPAHLWKGNARRNMYDAREKGRMRRAVPDTRERQRWARLTPAQCAMIKAARLLKDVSIFEVAYLLGIDFSAYSRLENADRTNIRLERLHGLLRYLNITDADFDLQPEQMYERGFPISDPSWMPNKKVRRARPVKFGRPDCKTPSAQVVPIERAPAKMPVPRAEGYDAQAIARAIDLNNSLPVSLPTLQRILRGERVKESTLLRVANHVGLSLDDLYRQPAAA